MHENVKVLPDHTSVAHISRRFLFINAKVSKIARPVPEPLMKR